VWIRSWRMGVPGFVNGRRKFSSVIGSDRRAPMVLRGASAGDTAAGRVRRKFWEKKLHVSFEIVALKKRGMRVAIAEVVRLCA
jgi:hypothetical protein